ncbi:MAG: hypothetical protein Q9218_007393, partial [Villophora microphyllina]
MTEQDFQDEPPLDSQPSLQDSGTYDAYIPSSLRVSEQEPSEVESIEGSTMANQTQKVRSRSFRPLYMVAARLKSSFQRVVARSSPSDNQGDSVKYPENHLDEQQDSWEDPVAYLNKTQGAEWNEVKDTTRVSVASQLSNYTNSFTQRLRATILSLRRRGVSSQSPGEWQTDDSWSVHTLEEPQPADQDIASRALKFTAPLSEASSLCPPGQGTFLQEFLSQRRYIDIHPDRKHRLAVFLARVCEEAAFDYVSMHAPFKLTLLRICAPDQVELSVWITLIDNIRYKNNPLNDGYRWPNASSYTRETEHESDDVTRLRQVAVHRWDYTSKLLEDVVWYLERLTDEPRQRQIESALEELYRDECAELSIKNDLPFTGDAKDTNLAGTVTISLGNSISGSTTLINDECCDGQCSTSADPAPVETSTSKQVSFLEEVMCTPRLAMNSHVTTYQQLLRMYQDILERSLFSFARKEFPTALLRYGYTSASQVELNQYSYYFTYEIRSAVPQSDPDEVRAIVEAGARFFRNATAHHREYQVNCNDPSTVDVGWVNDKQANSPATEDLTDYNKQPLADAQALAQLIGDHSAVQKMQMLAWAADINIRRTNEKIQSDESARSMKEWEILERAAKRWMRDFEGTERFESRGWEAWLYYRLEGLYGPALQVVTNGVYDLIGFNPRDLLGTGCVARDVMQVVDALDEGGLLNYWGFSYGTVLGVTVAAMFPDRMGQVVLDGNFNPNDYFVGRDPASSADDLSAKVYDLIYALKYHPFVTGSDVADIIDNNVLEGAIQQALYNTSTWPTLATALHGLLTENVAEAKGLLTFGIPPSTVFPNNDHEAIPSIRISDVQSWNPISLQPLFEEFYTTIHLLGDPLSCPALSYGHWPYKAKGGYTGNFNIKTKAPILVVGSKFDPITPLGIAQNASTG